MIIPIDTKNREFKESLVFDKFKADKLSPKFCEEDLFQIKVNESLIKETRGNAGDWPNQDMTYSDNYIDLSWHQREFEYELSFAYILRTLDDEYIGCAYIYPMNFRTQISNSQRFDLDFSFWINQKFYDLGFYPLVKDEFIKYLSSLGYNNIYYSNIV